MCPADKECDDVLIEGEFGGPLNFTDRLDEIHEKVGVLVASVFLESSMSTVGISDLSQWEFFTWSERLGVVV